MCVNRHVSCTWIWWVMTVAAPWITFLPLNVVAGAGHVAPDASDACLLQHKRYIAKVPSLNTQRRHMQSAPSNKSKPITSFRNRSSSEKPPALPSPWLNQVKLKFGHWRDKKDWFASSALPLCSLASFFVGLVVYHCCLERSSPNIQKSKPAEDAQVQDKSFAKRHTSSVSSDVEWLNRIVSLVWPRINLFLTDLVSSKIQPAIDKAMPSLLRGSVRVETCNLGEAHPSFGPIKVRDRSEHSCVIDVGVDVALDVDVSIKAMQVRLGVRQVIFRGKLTIVLDPPTNKPPFFGGLEAYFIDPPEISLDFQGAANIADCPGISNVVHDAIMDGVGKALVLPSRIAVDLDPTDELDIADIQCPDPIGVLRLTLHSGEGLPASDVSVFSAATSDPYVAVRLGQQSWQSPVKNKTLSPIWTEDNVVDYMVHDAHQHCRISVYDSDMIGSDDYLGEVKDGLPVRDFMHPGDEIKSTVPLQALEAQGSAGNLVISTRWLTFAEPDVRQVQPQEAVLGGPSQIFLSVKALSVTGLTSFEVPPFTLICEVADEPRFRKVTHPSKAKPGSAPVAQALQGICGQLAQRDMSEEEISSIVGLELQQVHMVLAAQQDQAASQLAEAESAKWRAITSPQWNQVLHLLVPWDEKTRGADVSLKLRDAGGKQIGDSFKVPLASLVSGPTAGERQGPFNLSDGIQVQARMRAKWLHHDEILPSP